MELPYPYPFTEGQQTKV